METGSYGDERLAGGGVRRVAAGQYRQSSESQERLAARQRYWATSWDWDWTGGQWVVGDTHDDRSAADRSSSQSRSLAGSYGPDGGWEEATDDREQSAWNYAKLEVDVFRPGAPNEATNLRSYDEHGHTDVPTSGAPSGMRWFRDVVQALPHYSYVNEPPPEDLYPGALPRIEGEKIVTPGGDGGVNPFTPGDGSQLETITDTTLDDPLLNVAEGYEWPWWEGTKELFRSLVVDQIYGGAKALVTGEAGTALGERAVGIVETQTGTPFSGNASEYGRLARGITGDLTGVNPAVEAGYGYDISNQSKIEGFERAQRAASGVAGLAGTAAGGLSAAQAAGRFARGGRFGAPVKGGAGAVGEVVETRPPVRLYHQGDLTEGVSGSRYLSTSLDPDLSHYHPGGQLHEFHVPADVYDNWRLNGLAQPLNDLHAPTGTMTPEIRIYPPASGQMNDFLLPFGY